MADNDAGIVIMPGGKYYIAVFVTDSSETDEENAAIIAHIFPDGIRRSEVGKSGGSASFAIVFTWLPFFSIPSGKCSERGCNELGSERQ